MLEFQSTFPLVWGSHCPTRILFGVGSLEQLPKMCEIYGTSALLITGSSALKTRLADRCLNLLRQAHFSVGEYHSVTPDPTVHQVNEIAEIVADKRFDMLVAVGGGSVADAAKAASVVAKQGGSAEEYLLGDRQVGAASVPVITVPTTAGTGAEVSKGAIITWPERSLKSGIRGDGIFPKAAVVDPSLTLSLPARETVITGFDLFTHAVETYISRRANPMTAKFSRGAVKAVCSLLPGLQETPDDLVARTELSYYSVLMGFNLANSTTCLPHRLQYPLGVLTQTAHAVGLAALYPAWMRSTYQASSRRFDDIEGWMKAGMVEEQKDEGEGVFGPLRALMQGIDLMPTLRDLGMDEEGCKRLATMVNGSLENDPWWQEKADLSAIYLAALDGSEAERTTS